MKSLWKIILIMLIAAMLAGTAQAAVNLSISPATDTYERNSGNKPYETITVRIDPTAPTDIEALGDIYLSYDTAVFEVVTTADIVDLATEAASIKWEDSIINPNYPPPPGTWKTIHYGKTNSDGSNWSVSSAKGIFQIRLFVKKDAVTGNTSVYFHAAECHIIDGETHTDVLGSISNAVYDITLDNTAPISTASPPGDIYNTTQNVVISTDEIAHDALIHFTTNNWVSEVVTTDPTFTIKAPGSIAQVLVTTLNYYAEDNPLDKAPNIETPTKQAVYIIDMENPVIYDVNWTQSVLGKFDTLQVTFKTSEEVLDPDVEFKIGGHILTREGSGTDPYVYTRTLTGDEDDGGVILISVTDLAKPVGNTGTNEDAIADLDFGGPDFTIVTTPDPVQVEETLTIDVTATEPLVASPSVVLGESIAELVSANVGIYAYSYTVTVSGYGWLVDLGDDNEPPLAYDFAADSSQDDEVDLDTPITFKLTDSRSGTNINTLMVYINSVPAIVSGQVKAGFTGRITSNNYGVYSIYLLPNEEFKPNKSIIVQIEVRDLSPSQNLGAYVFSFNTSSGGDLKVLQRALAIPTVFNPRKQDTEIAYKLSQHGDIELRIYNIAGNLVWKRRFAAGDPGGSKGLNRVVWDGNNDYEAVLSNGVYMFYIIDFGERNKTSVLADGKVVIYK